MNLTHCPLTVERILSTKTDLNAIHFLHGASAGSIIALALCLNIPPQAIMKLSFTFDLSKMMVEDLHQLDLNRLFEQSFDGCVDGNTILQTISQGMAKNNSLWHEAMTFHELHKLTKKHLIITTTNITRKTIENFDYKSYPDVPVLLALRMSIGIPGAFRPYTFRNMQYIDGQVFKQSSETIAALFQNHKTLLRLCVPRRINGGGRKNFLDLLINLINWNIKENVFVEDAKKNNIIEFEFSDRFTSLFDYEPSGLAKIYLDGAFQLRNALSSLQPR